MTPTPPGASPREAWRRHPADLARLVVAALVAAALAMVARFAPGTVAAVSTDLIRLFRELPAGFTAFLVGFVQLLAILAPVVFIGALLWRGSQRELAAVAVGAVTAAVAVALLDAWLASRAPAAAIANQRVDSWFTGAAFPSSAYLAAASATATAASASLARPWRRAVGSASRRSPCAGS